MKRHAIKNGQGKGNTPSATVRCRHMLRYICRVMCTVNSTRGIWTDACSSSCIRSVQLRSMQWTPLVIQSKRVSTWMRFEPPPKCRPRQDGELGMPRVAHIAAMLVWCSPMSENLGQELHANHAVLFPQPRKLDTVSHQLIAWRNVIAFSLTFLTISWIEIWRKWEPTPMLTQSSLSRSAGKCSIARATESVFTVRITTLRSPCRAQCATWSRMRVSDSSWEHGWRYSTSFMLFCVETIVSSSSVLMITFLPVSQACMHSDR